MKLMNFDYLLILFLKLIMSILSLEENNSSNFSDNRFRRTIKHLDSPSHENKALNSDSGNHIAIIFWSFFFGFLYTICMLCICYTCFMHKFHTTNIMTEVIDLNGHLNSNSINNEYSISVDKPYFINLDNSEDRPPNYESTLKEQI
jgi:hypothetical protein